MFNQAEFEREKQIPEDENQVLPETLFDSTEAQSAGTQSAGTQSAVTQSVGAQSAGTQSAGTQSVGAQSAMTQSAVTQSEMEQDSEIDRAGEGAYPVTVKYNGKERIVAPDEMRELLQKGLNYDHVLSERDTRYKRELDALDAYAEKNGMTRGELIKLLDRGKTDFFTPDEKAEFNLEQGFTRLFKEYPSLRVEEIPDEVMREVEAGAEPLTAYIRHENSTFRSKIAAMETQDKNKVRAVGSLAGDGAPEQRDDFLSGFLDR